MVVNTFNLPETKTVRKLLAYMTIGSQQTHKFANIVVFGRATMQKTNGIKQVLALETMTSLSEAFT